MEPRFVNRQEADTSGFSPNNNSSGSRAGSFVANQPAIKQCIRATTRRQDMGAIPDGNLELLHFYDAVDLSRRCPDDFRHLPDISQTSPRHPPRHPPDNQPASFLIPIPDDPTVLRALARSRPFALGQTSHSAPEKLRHSA